MCISRRREYGLVVKVRDDSCLKLNKDGGLRAGSLMVMM